MKPAAWTALFHRHPYLFVLVLASSIVVVHLVITSGYMFKVRLEGGKEILLAPAPSVSLTMASIDGGP